ncbi:MAG: tRNA (N6-threonylcarbamoyladenosine(37)-N6)-methyltransferase TrmO [Candidatus Helarchaeota archaeon]
MNEIIYRPIGTIHSPFKKSHDTPIQPSSAKGTEGFIEIFEEYTEGLKDLDGFSHVILIYHFHLAKACRLLVKPYMDDNFHGLFATRAPVRPNPIGISIVKLLRIEKNKLFIQNVDVIDNTPLLDIKPNVPQFNNVQQSKIGWLEAKREKFHTTNADTRFSK